MKKRRRELPEDLTDLYIADGEHPSALDVLAGRGNLSNQHEGNKRYWRFILAERPAYKTLGANGKGEKNKIAQSIYDFVLSTGGRFLQLDKENEKWFNLPQKIGLEKIKQALRDKYIPNSLDRKLISTNAAPLTRTSVASKDQCMGSFDKFPRLHLTSSGNSSILSSIFGQDSMENIETSISIVSLNTLSKPFDQVIEDNGSTPSVSQHENHILKLFELDSQPLRNCQSSSTAKRKRKREQTDDDLDAYVASNQYVSKRIRTLAGAIERHGKVMGDLQMERLMNKANSEILNQLKKPSCFHPSGNSSGVP